MSLVVVRKERLILSEVSLVRCLGGYQIQMKLCEMVTLYFNYHLHMFI